VGYNFNKSFRRKVDVSRAGSHRLEHHFLKIARGFVHRLDFLAELDVTGERFVFEEVLHTAIKMAYFKRGERTKGASRRQITRIMEMLREKEVISERMLRDRDGLHWGFIVTPHDALCVREGKNCVFTGPLAPGTVGKWVRRMKNDGDEEPDWSLVPRFWAPRGWIASDFDLIKSAPKIREKVSHEVAHQVAHQVAHDLRKSGSSGGSRL